MITYFQIKTSEEESEARSFVRTFFSDSNTDLLSLGSEHLYTWGAWDEGRLIGVLQVSCVLDEAEIIVIVVDPHYRRQGIGRNFLMQFFNRYSRMKSLFLEVSCKNEKAISFYKAIGFEQVGVRVKYYKNLASKEMEDAFIMKYAV